MLMIPPSQQWSATLVNCCQAKCALMLLSLYTSHWHISANNTGALLQGCFPYSLQALVHKWWSAILVKCCQAVFPISDIFLNYNFECGAWHAIAHCTWRAYNWHWHTLAENSKQHWHILGNCCHKPSSLFPAPVQMAVSHPCELLSRKQTSGCARSIINCQNIQETHC